MRLTAFRANDPAEVHIEVNQARSRRIPPRAFSELVRAAPRTSNIDCLRNQNT
jgi:hypothetical protein